MASKEFTLLLYLSFFIHFIYAVPERGIKDLKFYKKGQFRCFAKSLFKDAEITLSVRIVGSTDDGKPIKVEKELSLKWYLLYSDCAQNFVQIKDDVLSAMVGVGGERVLNPQHTTYKTGDLTLKDGHLKKTLPLGKEKGESTNPDETIVGFQTTTREPSEQANVTGPTGQQVNPPQKAKKGKPGRRKRDIQPANAQHKSTTKKLPKTPTTTAEKGKKKGTTQKPTTRKPTTRKPTTRKPTTPTTAMKGQPEVGMDGNYLLVISLENDLPEDASLEVNVRMKMNTGYLSAAEWPLLPFYGAMSLVYLAYGVVWLIVSACQWRELLRIQFWIGGVIALGMLEKAVLFSEYNNVNDTGVPAHGLVVLALVLSCIKRTLSRILIIIVSMGFGIVKPRLGAALHRVLGVGCLYFILCIIEGSYREFSVKADVNSKQVIASVPLSVLDAVICWWIFMSLLQTMRTLRIRKNLVKLSLYRHFTNILIVSVIASVAFMIWVIKVHHFNNCITDWKEIWIDDAFWHFLFALILLAIMVLWRPTANNQRYAFTPLIDVGEDDDDDMTLSDAFQGMKMRGKSESEAPSRAEKQRKKAEDDLKWVEENIPTSGGIDTALPSLLDSDEEMMTTKLEMNKME